MIELFEFLDQRGISIPLKIKILSGIKLNENDLFVEKNLDLAYIRNDFKLPDNLHVGRNLYLWDTHISEIPNDLYVGGTIYCNDNYRTILT